MQRLILALIDVYQYLLSPLFPNQCRFFPSCSAYTYEAIHRHGLWHGLKLSCRRLCTCHPFHKGGYDPVP